MSYEDKVKEQSRLRSQRYYEKNKLIIAERRKAKRRQIKEILTNHEPEIVPRREESVEPIKKKLKIKITANQTLTLPLCIQFFENNMTYSSGDKLLAKSTVEKYKKNIKQFFNLTGKNDLRPYLDNPQTVYDTINNSKLSIASKTDICVAILKLLNNNIVPNYSKAKYDLIDGYFRIFKGESDAIRKTKITDEKQAVDRLPVLEKLIKDKYGVNSKENIIMGLYREVPKRDDFYLKIVETNPKTPTENYLVVPKKGAVSVIVNIHKTGEQYKAETEKLSASLSGEIRAYMQGNKLKTGDFLFTNKKLGPFIKTMFGKVGKPEINGPTALRHSKVASTLSNKDITIQEATALAKTMKHSVKMQKGYNRVLKN